VVLAGPGFSQEKIQKLEKCLIFAQISEIKISLFLPSKIKNVLNVKV